MTRGECVVTGRVARPLRRAGACTGERSEHRSRSGAHGVMAQPGPVVARMRRHSMRVTEREPERLARRMPRMRRDIPRRRHNQHDAPPVNTVAFKATLHRRRTAVAEQPARKMPRIFRVRLRSGTGGRRSAEVYRPYHPEFQYPIAEQQGTDDSGRAEYEKECP